MALMTAATLQAIATRYNTKYTTLLTRQVGQQGISQDVVDVINLMLADLNTLITDINADDALAVTIPGYGVAPKTLGNVNAAYAAAASVTLATATAFSSVVAISGYTVTAGSTLPSWLTLNAGTGALTGTAPSVTTSTPYVFSVTATNAFGTSSTLVTINIG